MNFRRIALFSYLVMCACTSQGRLRVDGLAELPEVTSIEVRTLAGDSCDLFPSPTQALAAQPFSILSAKRGEDLSGQLPQQDHLVAVIGFDDACTVVAYACASARPGEDVRVEMSLSAPRLCDCRQEDGVCRSGIVADAGVPDASADFSISEDDSGPDDGCIRSGVWQCEVDPVSGGDADGDGLTDEDECSRLEDGCCEDTDSDLFPDYCDVDSDGDGAVDNEECAGEPCEAALDPTTTLCGGRPADLTVADHCGSCSTSCEGSPLRSLCFDRNVDGLRNRLCGPSGLLLTADFGRTPSAAEDFNFSLVAIRLSESSPVSAQVGPSQNYIASGGSVTGLPGRDFVDAAVEEAKEQGFGLCFGPPGFPDCIFAFALRVATLEGATGDRRCGMSREYIIVVSDGGSANTTYETSLSSRLPRVVPGWQLYRRADVLSSYVPIQPSRDPIVILGTDTDCRETADYVL